MPNDERNHTVPAFYLRGFADGSDRLRAYDKIAGRELPQLVPVTHATVHSHAYTVSVGGVRSNYVERQFSILEGGWSAAVRSGLAVFPPTAEARVDLSLFVAFQYMRVPRFRALFERAAPTRVKGDVAAFIEALRRSRLNAAETWTRAVLPDADPSEIEDTLRALEEQAYDITVPNEGFIKGIFGTAVQLAMGLADRPWRLAASPIGTELITSDAPVWFVPGSNGPGLPSAETVGVPLDRAHLLLVGPHGGTGEARVSYCPDEVALANFAASDMAERWLFAHPGSPLHIFEDALAAVDSAALSQRQAAPGSPSDAGRSG
jgi:hypothetical protein